MKNAGGAILLSFHRMPGVDSGVVKVGRECPVSSEKDVIKASQQPTIVDAERLWGESVRLGDSPGASIKGAGQGTARQGKPALALRVRQVDFPGDATGEVGDFEIIDRLGEGGMGVVLRARQVCADREVAVKMIRPEAVTHESAWVSFLAEAVVTADLDHPNIVPIHDIGTTQDGHLFYAMKEVRGTCWQDVIEEKNESENLEILLNVCDAVAFAHAKGIVHRDLKPENVMLGDFNEVLVMDWGLAVSTDLNGKAQHVTQDSGRAGTPAYMAPEMAKCETDKIGPASDIYPLGGILYEIVTGLRPHYADNVFACIYQAMENEIQGQRDRTSNIERPTSNAERTGNGAGRTESRQEKAELVEIALTAMATDPGDRYENVKAFQEAIRDYQSHAESVALAQRARVTLKNAKESDDYDYFAQALFGFREALTMWPKNKSASRGAAKTSLAYATCAFRKQDLDLAMSLLDLTIPSHLALSREVRKAVAERTARRKRLKALTIGSIALTAVIVVVLSIGFFWIRAERAVARAERDRAVTAEREARTAEVAEKEQHAKTEAALHELEYENYVNLIAVADARIKGGAFDKAEELLWRTPQHLRHWEWGYLMRQCHQDLLTIRGDWGRVFSVRFSPDGKLLATGTEDGIVRIWDAATGRLVRELVGHSQQIRSVSFSPDGRRLLTGGLASSARIWSVETGTELANLRCGGGVRAVAFLPNGKRVVTAGYDFCVTLWDTETGAEIRTLRGHEKVILSLSVSPDGRLLVSGSQDGTVRIWDTESGSLVRLIDLRTSPSSANYPYALAFAPDGKRIVIGGAASQIQFWDVEGKGGPTLLTKAVVSMGDSIAFSPRNSLFATGHTRDNHVRIWQLSNGRELKAFAGHGAKINSVTFSPDGRRLASGSGDGSVKLWSVLTDSETALLRHPGLQWASWSADGRRIATISLDRGRPERNRAVIILAILVEIVPRWRGSR